MTATRNRRQRGQYGTQPQQQPAGHRVRLSDFEKREPRPDEPRPIQARVAPWVGKSLASGRFILHFGLGTSLNLDKNTWVAISQGEFARLAEHRITIAEYFDGGRGRTVRQERPRFLFRNAETGEEMGDRSVIESVVKDVEITDPFARGERDAQTRALA